MLAFIHSLQLLHSFRPHPSSLQTYSVPVHFSPTWNLNGAASLGLFPPWPQISICPFPPLFSFPMAVFYFRRKLMKIIETCTTKRNLIFFNIWWRASPPTPKKRKPCQRHFLPPLTFMQCSESAGVSALTNLHLFKCDAWKKPELLD